MADDENAHDGALTKARDQREGWEWERDLEAQGHGGVWRRSRLERVCIHGRSDERVRSKVMETLARCPFDCEAVSVEVCDGEVRLSGVVGSVEEKVAIENTCARVHGARALVSALTVAAPRHVR